MVFKLVKKASTFTDTELLQDLQRVAKGIDASVLKQRDYNRLGKFSHKVFCRRFGSWNAALEKAGLTPSVQRIISDSELQKNLELIWRKLGRQPSYGEIRAPMSLYSVDTYVRRYGSWTKALHEFVRNGTGIVDFSDVEKSRTTAHRIVSRHINEKTRLKVMKRDNYACVICGRSPAKDPSVTLHIDHKVPFSKGGDSSEVNLRTLCDKCNLGRGADESV